MLRLNDDKSFSHFIAFCIICGNYNTIQSKSKKPKINERYAVNVSKIFKQIPILDKEIKL